jgi:transposase-like protein
MTSTTGLVLATEATQPSLIKTDVRGRMRRTPEQRERILDEYERSGLSGPKFAALCGVKYQTLAGWLAHRKSRRQARPQRRPQRKAVTQVRWLEASVQPATASLHGLLLELPGGVRAHLSNQGHVALAAALVRALEKPC